MDDTRKKGPYPSVLKQVRQEARTDRYEPSHEKDDRVYHHAQQREFGKARVGRIRSLLLTPWTIEDPGNAFQIACTPDVTDNRKEDGSLGQP